MQKMNLSWLVRAADACWVTPPSDDPAIDWIAASLEELRPGCLYIELTPGTAAEAAERGAAAVISGVSPEIAKDYPFPCAVVPDAPYDAFCRVAAWYRRQFHTRVLAIVGADGKTTIREMLFRILSQQQKTSRTRWELTGDLGVPKTLLGLDEDDRCAIVEMGLTARGSFARLGKICRPSAAIFTGVGSAHLGSYGSRETILRERLALTRAMESTDPLILCADDPLLYELPDGFSGDVVYYGIDTPCDVTGRIVSEQRDQTTLDISCCGKTTRVRLPLPGKGNCYNALAAFAAAVMMGVPEEKIREALEAFYPLPGRLSLMTTDTGTTIIDDSWTSTPESMKEAAHYFARFSGRRKIAVLGEMEDLGDYAVSYHRAAGRRLAQAGADLILAIGPYAAEIREGAVPYARTQVKLLETPDALVQYLRTDRQGSDTVLFKAGRSSHFERLLYRVYQDQGLRRIHALPKGETL